jgi:hypothetical protein
VDSVICCQITKSSTQRGLLTNFPSSSIAFSVAKLADECPITAAGLVERISHEQFIRTTEEWHGEGRCCSS